MSKKKPVEPYSKKPYISAMAIDSHAHLDYEQISSSDVIENMQSDGLCAIISIATGLESFSRVEQILKLSPRVYFALGLHPYDIDKFDENFVNSVRRIKEAYPQKMVAVGEIGLDLHGETPPIADQERVMREQLILANELNLPVVLHIRGAHQEAKELLRKNRHLLSRGGVVHCFSGTKEDAKDYLDLGLNISFTGAITYIKPSEKQEQAELLRSIPLDRIMIETDCPYLSPAPYRGKVNTPKMTLVVAEYISDILEMNVNDFINITTANTTKLFGLIGLNF